MISVGVDPGDPRNDQMLAMTAEDLSSHMENVRYVLDQAEDHDAPLSAIVGAIATNWIEAKDRMSRERLASLLALALVKLQAHKIQDEAVELNEFIRKLTGHPRGNKPSFDDALNWLDSSGSAAFESAADYLRDCKNKP